MTKISRLKRMIGPNGRPLTLADLPPIDLKRWLPGDKANIATAVRGGLITADEVCKRYKLTLEELEIWEQSLASHGIEGLRVSRSRRLLTAPNNGVGSQELSIEYDGALLTEALAKLRKSHPRQSLQQGALALNRVRSVGHVSTH
jgi:hypothetical protein